MPGPVPRPASFYPTIIVWRHDGLVHVSEYREDGSGTHWQTSKEPERVAEAVRAFCERGER